MRILSGYAAATAAVFALLGSMLCCGCRTGSRRLYVSPLGNDSNPGSKCAPFATPARAIEAVRNCRTDGKEQRPIQVLFREGTYRISDPLVFTPADSGSAIAPITYSAYPKERAVISGGRVLSGEWCKVEGRNYWKLPLPDARNRGMHFFSLFVNGESRTRARSPNYGEKVLRAAGSEPGGDPRQSLQFYEGDIDPSWTNPADIDVVLLCSWTPTLHRITGIVPHSRSIRFKSTHTRNVDFWERNFRYYLSNVFEALDSPGEWYLDRTSGILYYYPLPGEDPGELEFTVPVMKSSMIRFEADLEKHGYIENLIFDGLEFRHLDGDMDRHNGVYRQGHMFLSSAVSAQGLRNSNFRNCVFAQLGEYALELADGCRDVTVEQCHFWDIGAGAIQTGVTDLGALRRPVGANPLDENGCAPERAVRNLLIRDNYIHKLGTIWHGCYAIVNRFASHTKILHNEIFDIHWDAIGLDARWTWQGHKYCEGNEVAYNHLHHLGLGYHTDAAGIYQYGPLDTYIHHNLIHDTVAYPYICGYAGIYLDEQSRGALVENNLVYNTDWFALFQHKGTGNTFRNNLCAFARDGLISRGSRNEKWQANHMEAYRNIYLSTNSVMIGRDWDDGDKPPLINSNLYHSCSSATNLLFGRNSFAEWQSRGRDIHSVIAPAGCRNPRNMDFFLPPDADACRLIGFSPFNDEIARAGMRCGRDHITLPESYVPRKPTQIWQRSDFRRFAKFRIDFEGVKEGAPPPGIRQQGSDGTGGFFVTKAVKAYSGTNCLKAQDSKNLLKSFYPYLIVDNLRGLDSSPITFSFAVMQPESNPGPMTLEFRGDRGVGEAGPSISIAKDGKVTAGTEIARLKPGEWTHFTISFGLGRDRNGQWQLTVKNKTEERSVTLPFKSRDFNDLSWIGLMANDNSDSVFYLDDIVFDFESD